MALVELRNVSKIYHLGGEEIRALDDVSLEIEEGEFISIIGPSGSGKSTLMHILGCLDSPTEGTIKLDGTMIENASPRELAAIRNRKIGFVFQFFNLLPKLNVLQNVELPMVYSGLSGRDRRDRSMAALKMVDSWHPLGRMATIEEIGEVCAFLASAEASFITGQAICPDGGAPLGYRR